MFYQTAHSDRHKPQYWHEHPTLEAAKEDAIYMTKMNGSDRIVIEGDIADFDKTRVVLLVSSVVETRIVVKEYPEG